MTMFDASVYRIADRLDDVEPVDLDSTRYVWDGDEYDSIYGLLDETDLVDERPDESFEYADFVADEQAASLVENSENVTSRLVSQDADSGQKLDFDDSGAAQVFYEWATNRADYSFNTTPSTDDARPKDDKRVHELHNNPFLTVQEAEDGTVRYGLMTVGTETGESPCLYIHERFPSDIIYLEGTVDSETVEEAIEGELGDERAPELVDEACRLAPDDLEEGEMGDDVAEMYSMLGDDVDSFGYEQFVDLADELQDNIRELEAISDTMQKYYFSKAVEEDAAQDPNEDREQELSLKEPDFYRRVLESRIESFGDGYENARHAIRFTDLGTHRVLPYEPGEDGAELAIPEDSPVEERWMDRLEHEHPELYETLHDNHQIAATPVAKVLDSFRPKLREGPDGDDQRVDPAFMMAQIEMQGFDAVEEFMEEMLEDGEPWKGNETTDMMFQ